MKQLTQEDVDAFKSRLTEDMTAMSKDKLLKLIRECTETVYEATGSELYATHNSPWGIENDTYEGRSLGAQMTVIEQKIKKED